MQPVLIEASMKEWHGIAEAILSIEGDPSVRRGLAEYLRCKSAQLAGPICQRLRNYVYDDIIVAVPLFPADAAVVRSMRSVSSVVVTDLQRDTLDTIADITRMLKS